MSAVARYLMENIPLTKQATKKKLRQFLSIALAFTTTVSLSGFALLFAVTASAAVTPLSDGDLVRGPDGIKVYIVKPSPHGTYAGWKRHIFNPAVFNMYGHLSWSSIQSVNQETVDAYQTSDLYKELNDPRVYSLEESGTSAVKRWIENEAAFLANGYSWSQIFTVNEAERDYYVSGSPITTTVTPPVTPVTPAAGTGLTVSLASDTSASGSLVADSTGCETCTEGAQAQASMLKVNFAAGSDGDVTVTTVKVKRLGISSDSDISNAYLYDGNTRVAEMTNISSNVITFTNSAGLFTVSKSTSKAITVKMDLVNGASAGKTIALAINAASDVTAGSATVAGSYPIVGNYMTTARVSDLGQLTFGTVTAPSSVDPGQTGIEVVKLPLTSAGQKLKVSYVRFTNVGTIATTDLTNLKLMDGATQLGSTASIATDSSVVFDLSSSPLEITAGQTKNLSLTADIVAGTARQFKFTIQRSSDIVAMDTNYGTYVKPGMSDSFTVKQPTDSTNVSSGNLTISVDPATPTGNIAAGYTDQEMARFTFKASGEAIKITSLSATSTVTSSLSKGVKNVKLYLDGTQVGATTDLSISANTAFNFGNSFIIPAGTTKTLVVKGEVKNAAGANYAANDTIKVSLVTGSDNAQRQVSMSTFNTTSANGSTLTVQTGLLTVAANSAMGNASSNSPTAVKGATGVKIGSFVITAGAGEAVSVTQIIVQNNGTLGQGLGSDFYNLTLKNGSTQIGTTVGNLSAAINNTYTFTPATSITINAGQQYVVDAYADVLSTASNTGSSSGYAAVLLDSITATGKSTSLDASRVSGTDVNGQQIYLATSGNLTITIGSDTPIAQLRSMGQTGQTLATFKLTAGAPEAVDVTKLIITDVISGSSTAATGTVTDLQLFTSTGISLTSNPVSIANDAKATFDGLTLQIPKGKSETLTLKGKINDYTSNAAISNSIHTFKIAASSTDVVAKGEKSGPLSGGDVVVTNATGTAQTVYQSELSVAHSYSCTSPCGGAGSPQTVDKYTFTNTSAGGYAITVTNLDLNISTTLQAGTGTVTLRKNTTGGTLLATKTFNNAVLANITTWDSSDAFTSFTIDAGTSVDVYVLADTAAFMPSTPTGRTFSTSIGSAGPVWKDETTPTNYVNSIDGAPVYGVTITY